jgi:hypothetical protein
MHKKKSDNKECTGPFSILLRFPLLIGALFFFGCGDALIVHLFDVMQHDTL